MIGPSSRMFLLNTSFGMFRMQFHPAYVFTVRTKIQIICRIAMWRTSRDCRLPKQAMARYPASRRKDQSPASPILDETGVNVRENVHVPGEGGIPFQFLLTPVVPGLRARSRARTSTPCLTLFQRSCGRPSVTVQPGDRDHCPWKARPPVCPEQATPSGT